MITYIHVPVDGEWETLMYSV